MTNIKELCINNEYFCSITQLKENGVKIKLPENILYNLPSKTISYILKDNKLLVKDSINGIKSYCCPNYGLRVLLIIHIFMQSMRYSIDRTLCVYYNNNGEVVENGGISKLTTKPFAENENKKEEYLGSMAMELMSGNIPNMKNIEDVGITEGYSCIMSLFEEED